MIGKQDIRENIYTTDIDGLDVVPSHVNLSGADVELLQMERREFVIKEMLAVVKRRLRLHSTSTARLARTHHRECPHGGRLGHHPRAVRIFRTRRHHAVAQHDSLIKMRLNPELEIEGVPPSPCTTVVCDWPTKSTMR